MVANIEPRRFCVFVSIMGGLIALAVFKDMALEFCTYLISSGWLRLISGALCATLSIIRISRNLALSGDNSIFDNFLIPIWDQLTNFSLVNCGIYLIHGAFQQGFSDLCYFNHLDGIDLFFIGIAGFITCIHSGTELWASICIALSSPHEISPSTVIVTQ